MCSMYDVSHGRPDMLLLLSATWLPHNLLWVTVGVAALLI